MISFFIEKIFIRVKYISLVNIIANKLVVEELIQNNFNVDNLQLSIKNILLEKIEIIKLLLTNLLLKI